MVTKEFKKILEEIIDQNWSLEEWAAHEADDWFQSKHFNGGFEADETYKNGEFNFSFYDQSGKEWWFTFKLNDVDCLLENGFDSIELVDPETFDYDSLS